MRKALTRREFVATTGGILGLALTGPLRAAQADGTKPAPRSHGRTIVVFQGDSITDGWRDRKVVSANQGAGLGTAYPLLVAAAALRAHPEAGLQFYNRGVGMSRVLDLHARWEEDTLALKPDLVSILIGVNDLWHKLTRGFTGTVADYERDYSALLERTRGALPKARLVVMEPFALRCGDVNEKWFPEFDERRAAAARIAKKAGATLVPLQEMFDGLAAEGSAKYWAWDGAHPTPAGDAAIAERWRQVVGL